MFALRSLGGLGRSDISRLHVFFGAGNSDGIALFDGFGRQFLADTGLVGHGVAAIDRLVVVQAGFAAFRAEGALVVLVNDKVGNNGFNLKGRRLEMGLPQTWIARRSRRCGPCRRFFWLR